MLQDTSSGPTSEEIAALAYLYYLDEGRPEGRSAEHWCRAESFLKQLSVALPKVSKSRSSPKTARTQLPAARKRAVSASSKTPRKRSRPADGTP